MNSNQEKNDLIEKLLSDKFSKEELKAGGCVCDGEFKCGTGGQGDPGSCDCCECGCYVGSPGYC